MGAPQVERIFFVLHASEFEEELKAWMLARPASATIHLGWGRERAEWEKGDGGGQL